MRRGFLSNPGANSTINQYTHRSWGAANVYAGENPVGYAVIVRYGHFLHAMDTSKQLKYGLANMCKWVKGYWDHLKRRARQPAICISKFTHMVNLSHLTIVKLSSTHRESCVMGSLPLIASHPITMILLSFCPIHLIWTAEFPSQI